MNAGMTVVREKAGSSVHETSYARYIETNMALLPLELADWWLRVVYCGLAYFAVIMYRHHEEWEKPAIDKLIISVEISAGLVGIVWAYM